MPCTILFWRCVISAFMVTNLVRQKTVAGFFYWVPCGRCIVTLESGACEILMWWKKLKINRTLQLGECPCCIFPAAQDPFQVVCFLLGWIQHCWLAFSISGSAKDRTTFCVWSEEEPYLGSGEASLGMNFLLLFVSQKFKEITWSLKLPDHWNLQSIQAVLFKKPWQNELLL